MFEVTTATMRRATTCLLALVALSVGCSSSSTALTTSGTVAATATAAPDTVASTVPETTPATTSTTAPVSIDPCTLVTKAEAAAIVGVALNDPITAGNPDDLLCQYTSDPTGPTAQVEVFTGLGPKKQLDIDKDTLQHDFTQLTGIGDEAWLESDNVFVRKGDNWASVNVVALDADPTAVQSAITATASVMVSRMP